MGSLVFKIKITQQELLIIFVFDSYELKVLHKKSILIINYNSQMHKQFEYLRSILTQCKVIYIYLLIFNVYR